MRQITMVALILAASAGFLAAQDPPGRVARLNYREGPVSFQPNGVDEWVDAGINRPMTTGDQVWVGDGGRSEFHIGSMALRLSAHSDFEFLNLDDQTVQIRLSEGSLLIRLRNLAAGQVVEIDTPNLAFNLRRPGIYRIDARPDSQTTVVTVRDGEGEVTGDGQSFPLYARQRAEVRGGDQLEYNLTPAGGGDEFDQWCSSRDRREDQSQSARYVSREVPGYDDLDQYGSWSNQPDYGPVWMPASVASGWAPYHDGHWAWIAPWGWTWVDDAPWGFAPYHYGRWASFGGRWGWVPGPSGVAPTYAPAMVAWVGGGGGGSGFSMSFSTGTAAAIGWFALGPREPYYPSYPVSQRYFSRVNSTNTVINNVTINNYYNSRNTRNTNAVYVNQRVQNGVIAVPQSAFASGGRVNQYARPVSAAQVAAVHIAPGPFIVPQRQSVLGPQGGSNGRPAMRPPASVLTRRVVARTAPPPAALPFDRQQAALARNPGRPLPVAEVRQIRQAAPAPAPQVRVVDMSKVKRIQPAMHTDARPGQQPNAPQAPGPERKNFPSGQQPQKQQQQDAREQQQKQQQDAQRGLREKQEQGHPALAAGEAATDARPGQQPNAPQAPGPERKNFPSGQQPQKQQQQDAREQQQKQQQDAQRGLREKHFRQDNSRRRSSNRMRVSSNRSNSRMLSAGQREKQQQDTQRLQQQKQQQDAREQQQKQQQDAQRAQREKQQQDAREQQMRQQREAQQRQKAAPAPRAPAPQPRPEPKKEQKPPEKEDKPKN
ncbi:DUF6600 domain-containing protein [Paludibaculum fermentans]|uniref:FecR protein n=1 Tax=Paludibaculum fermentans TaxID=1473598 RepID=A0A7S7NPI0_PALFE|nr:DUF6600 domain-containing protein [Paludibaculum fermentans]QOY86894.1 FecR protein [Paludibaculum fermentans]